MEGGLGDGLKKQICSKKKEKTKKKEGRFTAREFPIKSFKVNKKNFNVSTFEIPAKSAEPIVEIPVRDRSPPPPPPLGPISLFSYSSFSLYFFFLLPLFGHF